MTSQWQPIETAPKDGLAVLLWPYQPGDVFAGRAMEEVVLGYRTMDEEWYNPEQRETFEPTHWMPLPEPPEDIQS
jgi:hypothetical protein